MTGLVTEQLPLVAGAPDGIKALRGLIQELALRGKLIPQDQRDTPASTLLRQIAEEQAELIAKGIVRQPKQPPELSTDSVEFDLPNNWRWASVASLVLQITDGTHHTPTYLQSGIPFISVKDIDGKTINFNGCKYISKEQHNEINARCNPEIGDILLCRIGTLGRPTIVDTEKPFSLFVSVGLLKLPKKSIIARFLHLALSSPLLYRQYAVIKAGGSHTNKLNLGDIPRLCVPVPPLAEQHRIVTKVDELMALCDRLEADQADAQAAHTQLVQALLGSLTQATDATDFRASWQRLSEHFHTLFTTEASIDALKQTVLRLGFMGKLVPQIDSARDSSRMIDAIAEAKVQLPDAGRLRQANDSAPATRGAVPFEFPASWQVARMADLCEPITSGATPPSSEMSESVGIPFLKVYNIRDQRIDFGYKPQFVNETYHLTKLKRSALKPNDVVMNIVGPPLGKVAIIPDDFAAWNCNQAIVFFRLIAPMNPRFVHLFLCEGSFLEGIDLIGTAGQDNISVTKSRNIVMPVPTAAEQHRIVAKVDELMALCDQLKGQLIEARQQHAQLASVLVEQAVAA